MSDDLNLPDPPEQPEGHGALVAQAGALAAPTEDTLPVFATVLADLAKALKDTEAARTNLVKPLNDHVKWINAQFKPRTQAIEAAQRKLKSAITAFHTARQLEAEAARKAEEEARAAAEALMGVPLTGDAPVAAPVRTEAHSHAGSLGTTRRWTYEVADKSVVPPEYLELDRSAVRTEMNRQIVAGHEPRIPGLHFRQETDVAVRPPGGQ